MTGPVGEPAGGGLVLALDSATDVPSFAVGTAADPGEDLRLDDRRALSRDIERVVSSLLAARGVRAADLTAVLVADGPGSFTGLRIGAAFAKGLSRALGVPLLTAPSLLGAAAHAARRSGRALPVEVEVRYDALRGQCYRAIYRIAGEGVEEVAGPALASAAPAGHGLPAGRMAADEAHASAASLLNLLGRRGGPAAVGKPGSWEPSYGRPAEAEARRLAGTSGTPGA